VTAQAEGTRLARGAEVALLERAEVGRRRPVERRGRGEQHVGLQAADEQGVAVFLEAAAAAATGAAGSFQLAPALFAMNTTPRSTSTFSRSGLPPFAGIAL